MSAIHTCGAESPTTSGCTSKSARISAAVPVKCTTNSTALPSYHKNLPSAASMSNYAQSGSSAMSAAAAAAFILQAAANTGSLNGANASPSSTSSNVRRSSTTSLFESPQVSPSLSTAMISAAVQQAAALAAAKAAIDSSNPSPASTKNPSDLQAAAISLASVGQNDAHRHEAPHDIGTYPSQAVTEFLFLSEKHPELLPHSTLASVFRRRSSNVLTNYLTDAARFDKDNEEIMKSITGSNASARGLDAISHEEKSLFGSPAALGTKQFGFPDQLRAGGGGKVQLDQETDPYQFTALSSLGVDEPVGNAQHFTSLGDQASFTSHLGLLSSAYAGDRGFSRINKCSPNMDASGSRVPLPHGCARTQCLSPHQLSAPTDALTALCPSSSPLSCSSLSNSTTPQTNISPLLTEYRNSVNSSDFSSDATARTGLQGTSVRDNYLNERDIKPEFSAMCVQEPNRKREQRLIKNREAARECRRKKKEYVRCLEARVSLLESQNQQLIDELNKVKALCFKDLCGLGFNSSTVACAAAVLAAASSTTYTIPSISTTTSVRSPDSVVSTHLNDQALYSQPNPTSALDEQSPHFYRTHDKRHPLPSNSKSAGSETTGSSNEQHSSSHCLVDYSEQADPRDVMSSESFSHMRQSQLSSMTDSSQSHSPPQYESFSPSGETYRAGGQMVKSRLFGHLTRHDSHSNRDPVSSEYFVQPPFGAAKRVYHDLTTSSPDDRKYSDQCSEFNQTIGVSPPKNLKSTDSESPRVTTGVTKSEQCNNNRSQVSS